MKFTAEDKKCQVGTWRWCLNLNALKHSAHRKRRSSIRTDPPLFLLLPAEVELVAILPSCRDTLRLFPIPMTLYSVFNVVIGDVIKPMLSEVVSQTVSGLQESGHLSDNCWTSPSSGDWMSITISPPAVFNIQVKKVTFSNTRYRVWARSWSRCTGSQKSSPAVGCHHFPPGLWSPSQPKNVTVLRPVLSYTAWWQRHIDVNNLPKVAMQLPPVKINPRPTDRTFKLYC